MYGCVCDTLVNPGPAPGNGGKLERNVLIRLQKGSVPPRSEWPLQALVLPRSPRLLLSAGEAIVFFRCWSSGSPSPHLLHLSLHLLRLMLHLLLYLHLHLLPAK